MTKISAGSYDLNKFLYGGYEEDIITTIYGDAGAGKTNFCILAAVSQTKKESKVIFMDTEGGFSAERFKQIAGEEYKRYLENVILLKPVNFEEQIKNFNILLKELKNNHSIKLIIVDGMTMLYRLEITEARSKKDDAKIRDINGELARQMRALAEIARTKNIAVIVTNQGYHEFIQEEEWRQGKRGETKMVGGDIMKYWSKCIIELKNEKNKRKMILRKHRSLGEKDMDFEIVNSGIRKRGWL
jgi:DNA repair protein RadB